MGMMDKFRDKAEQMQSKMSGKKGNGKQDRSEAEHRGGNDKRQEMTDRAKDEGRDRFEH